MKLSESWGGEPGRRKRRERCGGSGGGFLPRGAAADSSWVGAPAAAVMSDYKVELVEDNISEFHVVFKGPPDSAFCWMLPLWCWVVIGCLDWTGWCAALQQCRGAARI